MSFAAPRLECATHNTKTLYHCTDSAGARAVADTGFMLRGDRTCMFGSGIYFAETAAIAKGKAWHGRQNGCIIKARVDLGNVHEPTTANQNLCWEMLQGNVPGHVDKRFQSVWAKPKAQGGPMAQYDEWIVYNAYQVEIVSITDVDGKAIEFKNARAKPTKRSTKSLLMDFAL